MRHIHLGHDLPIIKSKIQITAIPSSGPWEQATIASLKAQYGPGRSVELCTVLPDSELAWTLERAKAQRLKRNNIGLSALAGLLAVLSLAVLGFIIASVPHAVSASTSGATLVGDRSVGGSVHYKNSTVTTWMATPTGHSRHQCCKVPVWWV